MGTLTGTERSDQSERPTGADQQQSRPPRAARGDRGGRGLHTELDYRPSYLAAGITTALVFGLYLITLAPSTAMWDTSEYIAAAYVLGLPHPPGNPFFILFANVFGRIPIGSYAERINVLAALCSAVSAGMWFLITERVLVSWLPERWQRIVGGVIAALIGATAFTVWNQSVVNEKVYTVSLAFFAIVAWLTVRWCDEAESSKTDRILVLIAYLLGLGYANHPAGFLAGPAVAVAVLWRRWHTVLRWRLLLACVGALILGMTPFAMQPIRAAHFPAINEGEPTACETKIAVDCTFSKLTYQRFKYNFDREQYGKPSLSERQAPFGAQLGMWWLYFKWQWLRDPGGDSAPLQNVLAVLFFGLGLLGGYAHWRRDPSSFSFYGPLMLTLTVVLVYYMNFKYGASQAPELNDVAREVRDRDYFFIWSFSAWGVWASLGLIFVWETIAALIGADAVKVGKDTVEMPRRNSWLASSPILAFAFLPLITNWDAASRRGETDTRDFAHDLLNSVEPYGVLVTVGDNDTFPLWYAQEVEGIRRDVVIANTSLLNTDWYTRQLIRRPVYEYDAAKGPAIYRGKQWQKPSGPPLKMTMAEADAVPLFTELPGPRVMRVPGTQISATIDPRQLDHGVLERADYFVLRMILDAFPQRPVYFSRTSGNYGGQLGLQPYLLTQGLARRLLPAMPTPGPDTLLVPGEGFLDLPRTKALWTDVFEAQESIIRKGDWVDRPSVGIPALYMHTGLLLGTALQSQGQSQLAEKVLTTAEQVAKVTRLEDVFAQSRPQVAPAVPIGDSAAREQVPVKTP
jgi:hypothetical protein